jgi:hypothetical protein
MNGENKMRMYVGCWWESWRERDHWEDEGAGGWIILN